MPLKKTHSGIHVHVYTHVEKGEMGTKKKCTNFVNFIRRAVIGEEGEGASFSSEIFNRQPHLKLCQ